MTVHEAREQSVQLMKSRKMLNQYTNDSERKYFYGYPDNIPWNTEQKGFSDCSSACRAVIRTASGFDIGRNTDQQLRNRMKGLIIEETDGGMPDETKLLPGDCLYFKGNKNHLLDVGHVEMYVGGGQVAGHGEDKGPKIKDMMEYCAKRKKQGKPYFMAIRWIHDGTFDPEAVKGEAHPILRKGMSGEAVKELQTLLIGQDYGCGTWGADGEFGKDTLKAVKRFQAEHGLDVDGIVGPKTWAALDENAANDLTEDAHKEPGEVMVSYGSWRIRSGPGTWYETVGFARAGDKFERSGKEAQGWVGIKYRGDDAWISGKGVIA